MLLGLGGDFSTWGEYGDPPLCAESTWPGSRSPGPSGTTEGSGRGPWGLLPGESTLWPRPAVVFFRGAHHQHGGGGGGQYIQWPRCLRVMAAEECSRVRRPGGVLEKDQEAFWCLNS